MPVRSLFLAAYDVCEPSRLRCALDIVKEYATGGQKSAYEVFLTPNERTELLGRMQCTLDLLEDSFALIPLGDGCRVHTLGIATAPEDPPFFYFG